MNPKEEQEEEEKKKKSAAPKRKENWRTMNPTMIHGVRYVKKWRKIST